MQLPDDTSKLSAFGIVCFNFNDAYLPLKTKRKKEKEGRKKGRRRDGEMERWRDGEMQSPMVLLSMVLLSLAYGDQGVCRKIMARS